MAKARTKGSRQNRIGGDANAVIAKLSKARLRKLEAAEPGAILMFDSDNRTARDRQMLRRGEMGPSRAGAARFSTQMVYKAPLAFAGDVRGLIRFVQLAAAMHFHDSILGQVEADGAKRLPSHLGGPDKLFGIDTGDFYTAFRIRPVAGSSVKATGVVQTPGDEVERIEFSRQAYIRNIDLVSSRGTANRVIQQALQAYMAAAYGSQVRVPRDLHETKGYILRDALKAITI